MSENLDKVIDIVFSHPARVGYLGSCSHLYHIKDDRVRVIIPEFDDDGSVYVICHLCCTGVHFSKEEIDMINEDDGSMLKAIGENKAKSMRRYGLSFS